MSGAGAREREWYAAEDPKYLDEVEQQKQIEQADNVRPPTESEYRKQVGDDSFSDMDYRREVVRYHKRANKALRDATVRLAVGNERLQSHINIVDLSMRKRALRWTGSNSFRDYQKERE